VLLAAAADGRFDVMLLVYNFINHAPGDKVLAACAKRNIGATLMKVAPGRLKLQPLDPQRLTAGQERRVAIWVGRGMTRAQALAKLARRLKRAEARAKKNRPLLAAFVAKHGIETEEQLARRSVQWALRHPGAQSACVSIADFAGVDSILPASGAALSRHDAELLRDVAALYHGEHCRHGCNACAASCPRDVPVSTVMRYAYYFELQRREKLAIGKYARLAVDAAACADCPGWCEAACPHGLAVQAQLLAAHDRLTLA